MLITFRRSNTMLAKFIALCYDAFSPCDLNATDENYD